jgi:hypothetical protein
VDCAVIRNARGGCDRIRILFLEEEGDGKAVRNDMGDNGNTETIIENMADAGHSDAGARARVERGDHGSAGESGYNDVNGSFDEYGAVDESGANDAVGPTDEYDAVDESGANDADVANDESARDTAASGPIETFGVTCPLCGGSLRIREGERSISCEYCGSGLVVTRPHGIRSFMMQPRITPGKARLTALQYLSEQTGGRVKARHASIVDIKMVHVPFWRVHGRLMGWICGHTITLREEEIPSPDPRCNRTIKTVKEDRHPSGTWDFREYPSRPARFTGTFSITSFGTNIRTPCR